MATAEGNESDWQCGKTLAECFDHIFTYGALSDVTFLIGEDKNRITAHKLVLISRSPVFYAMFEGPLAEKGDIPIPDVSEDSFRLFLRYLYTDKIDLSEENIIPVLSVARKYCVDILVSQCEEFLYKILSVDNACLFLELAHTFMMDKLEVDCRRLIVDSSDAILRSSFSDLCRSCVTSITESEDLLADESDVYNAVVWWAEAECKRQNLQVTPDTIRKVLGNILYNVRFPVMDNDSLQKKVCHDQILSAEEVVQAINYQHHHAKVSGSKLNHNERGINIATKLWRVDEIVESNGIEGMETVSFSVSNNIQLLGFGSFYSLGNNSVKVDIYENDKVVYKADNISRVKTDSDHIGEVFLKNRDRIQLNPGFVYTIVENTSSQRKCHGRFACMGPLQSKNTEITFESPGVPLPNVRGHNRQQIPYLLLNSDTQ